MLEGSYEKKQNLDESSSQIIATLVALDCVCGRRRINHRFVNAALRAVEHCKRPRGRRARAISSSARMLAAAAAAAATRALIVVASALAD